MAGASNPSICKIGPPTAAYEGPNRLSTGPAKSKQPALAAMLAKAHRKSENFKRSAIVSGSTLPIVAVGFAVVSISAAPYFEFGVHVSTILMAELPLDCAT